MSITCELVYLGSLECGPLWYDRMKKSALYIQIYIWYQMAECCVGFSIGRQGLRTRHFSLRHIYFLSRRLFLHIATNQRQDTQQVKAKTTLDTFSFVCSQLSLQNCDALC